jgi:REP element-mobilizing transposase RayT
MNRGRRKERIYHNDDDFYYFISLVKKSIELWSIQVAGYCLMTNHYHLLIQTLDANLPRCMRHIDGVYTQRFNRKYGKDGSLFRGRYKAVLIDADGYLVEVLRYLHRNPSQAGLEDRIGEYKWTSHHGYLSKARKWSWLHKENALSILSVGFKNPRKAYIDFMNEGDSEEIMGFYSKKNLKPVMGSSDFLQKIKDGFSDAIFNEEIPVAQSLRSSAEEVIAAVSSVYNVEPDNIRRSRRGRMNEARDIAMMLTRKWTGLPLTSIAHHFNLKRHGSVTTALARASETLRKSQASQSMAIKVERLIKVSQQST